MLILQQATNWCCLPLKVDTIETIVQMLESSSYGQDLVMAPLAKVASEGHRNVKHKLDFDKLKPNSNLKLIWRLDVGAYIIVNVEQFA